MNSSFPAALCGYRGAYQPREPVFFEKAWIPEDHPPPPPVSEVRVKKQPKPKPQPKDDNELPGIISMCCRCGKRIIDTRRGRRFCTKKCSALFRWEEIREARRAARQAR